MNTLQIVVKTVATTINLLIGFVLVKTKDVTPSMFKCFLGFMLINLMGVWV